MKIRYLEAADAEFYEAINYYNDQHPGLGFEFSDEVKDAIARIQNYHQPGRRSQNVLAAAKSIDFPTASFTKYEPIRSSSSQSNTTAASP